MNFIEYTFGIAGQLNTAAQPPKPSLPKTRAVMGGPMMAGISSHKPQKPPKHVIKYADLLAGSASGLNH